MDQYIEFAQQNLILFVALLGILGWLIGSEVLRKIRGVSNINPTQALQLINQQDALVLDIREVGEFKEGHIPDARHLPLNKLQERLGELQKFKNKPVIVYCRAGISAGGACSMLKKSGFETVYNLGGGLPAWQNANLPVRKK